MNSYTIAFALMVLVSSSMAAAPATSQAAPDNTSKVEMIFWENQIWKPGGGGERLTLWGDGRSEIRVRRFGDPLKARAGWTVKYEKPFSYYTKANPLPKDDATRRFQAALAAGIESLRSFPGGYYDGSGTLVGIGHGADVQETSIPEFMYPERKDNQGSENHKRFLAVQKAIGDFDNDAIEP